MRLRAPTATTLGAEGRQRLAWIRPRGFDRVPMALDVGLLHVWSKRKHKLAPGGIGTRGFKGALPRQSWRMGMIAPNHDVPGCIELLVKTLCQVLT